MLRLAGGRVKSAGGSVNLQSTIYNLQCLVGSANLQSTIFNLQCLLMGRESGAANLRSSICNLKCRGAAP